MRTKDIIKIAKETGNLVLNNSLTIYPEMNKEQLVELFKNELEIDNHRDDWWKAEYSNAFDGTYCFLFKFTFFKNVFISIEISLSETPFGSSDGSGWDSVSYESEMKMADKYSQWLSSQIGFERQFSWGEALSGFDERGFTPYMYLRYNAFETVYRASVK